MRKPAFCICENKDTDQLRYIDRTVSLLSKFKIFKHLAIFCGYTARFVSDLVGNPEDRFSCDAAHISSGFIL